MDDLILIGGGGHCKSCIDVIEEEGRYNIVGILDAADKVGTKILGYPIIGTDDSIKDLIDKGYCFLITVGQITSSDTRSALYGSLCTYKARMAKVISPFSHVSSRSEVGDGTIVMHGAIVNASSSIGANCIINTHSLVEHDCFIGDNSHISTGAIVNGGTKILAGTFFGSNAVSKQGVESLKNDFIKAGSCFKGYVKKSMKTAVLSVIYPVDDEFVHDYFKSLVSQDVTNFDIIMLNDGFKGLDKFKEIYSTLRIIEVPSAKNIAKNRSSLIKYALLNGYDVAVFADVDDYFSGNRISKSTAALEQFDIVVNDISTFNGSEVVCSGFLSQRYEKGQNIVFEDILEKNIFGLSNTAIRLKGLDIKDLELPEENIAVDWFLFSVLLHKGRSAVFSNEIMTYYRQHEDNIVGMGRIDSDSIKKALSVKSIHYSSLKFLDERFFGLFDQTQSLISLSEDNVFLKKFIKKSKAELDFPMWWETARYEA